MLTLKDYEYRHNSKYPDKPIKIIKRIGNDIYFKTEFGICKKVCWSFGRTLHSIRAAIDKTDYLKNQLISLYGFKYKYNELVYNDETKRIEVECKQHGKFTQCFKAHIRGQGCPDCNTEIRNQSNSENSTGWSIKDWKKAADKSKNFNSFKVYIIECFNNEEKFYKIGRTFQKMNKRFLGKVKMPYKYKVIKIFTGSSEYVYDLELSLKKYNKENKYIPKIHFVGKHECYNKIKLTN